MRSNNLYTILNPKSLQSEAFRILRTNLQFAKAGGQLKTIVITSAASGEGKSTTSINLAVTLANAGNDVLLIDGDLRKPSVHKYLLISSKKGLSNILAGLMQTDDVVQDTEISGLQVIASGPIPPNPAELLHSREMEELLADQRAHYDYIIIDSPPAVAVTDSAILSTISDGTILVVSSRETPIEIAKTAKNNLKKVGANILGVVVNKVKIQDQHFQYYQYENRTEKSKSHRRKKKRG